MSTRICDHCGKERDTAGGKTCENRHFICKDCVWGTAGLLSSQRKYCPLCGKPLR